MDLRDVIKAFLILLVIGLVAVGYDRAPTHHLAPTGTYYLSDYVSFTTPRGVIGWTPGQEVHEVVKAPFVQSSLTVTDGDYMAVIPETALTREMEGADAMLLADNATQGQVREKIMAARAHYENAQHSAIMSAAQDINRANAQHLFASTVGTSANRLNEPVRSIGGGYSTIYYGVPYRSGAGATTASGSAVAGSPLNQSGNHPYAPYDQQVGPLPSPTPYPGGIAR